MHELLKIIETTSDLKELKKKLLNAQIDGIYKSSIKLIDEGLLCLARENQKSFCLLLKKNRY